eukprot:3349280-Pleurochrysis_carterae.AAC.4
MRNLRKDSGDLTCVRDVAPRGAPTQEKLRYCCGYALRVVRAASLPQRCRLQSTCEEQDLHRKEIICTRLCNVSQTAWMLRDTQMKSLRFVPMWSVPSAELRKRRARPDHLVD